MFFFLNLFSFSFFAGVVEEIGSKVKNFKLGDAVLGHKVSLIKIQGPHRLHQGVFLAAQASPAVCGGAQNLDEIESEIFLIF